MDKLQRSDFLSHLTGKVFLSQHDAMKELSPEITAQTDSLPRPISSLLEAK
jgi:SulP family sulfate permease